MPTVERSTCALVALQMTDQPALVEQRDRDAAKAFWTWHISDDPDSDLATAFALARQPLEARITKLEAGLRAIERRSTRV